MDAEFITALHDEVLAARAGHPVYLCGEKTYEVGYADGLQRAYDLLTKHVTASFVKTTSQVAKCLVLLALTAGLWPLAAHAAPITIDWGIHERRSTNPVAETRDAVLFVTRCCVPDPDLVEWRVPDLGAGDIGQMFTLTEANAASWGTDFSELVRGIQANQRLARSGFPSPGSVDFFWRPQPTGDTRYQIDSIESITFTVHEYFSNPLGSVLRWQHVAYGEGSVVPVPEPAAITLVLIVASARVLRSRNRAGRNLRRSAA